MEFKVLLKAGMKRHRGSLSGIFFLVFLVSVSLLTVVSLWSNAGSYIHAEMERVGFGDLTVWISAPKEPDALNRQIKDVDAVARVESQPLFYADYTANGVESDSEGQLILYREATDNYRFFKNELNGYEEGRAAIEPGAVYVSPSLISMMEVEIGDEISFATARNGGQITLKAAGYYEDPFMGSSMIGMKGFLISEADYQAIHAQTMEAGIDALAREGAMLHIFAEKDSGLTAAELNVRLNQETNLPLYTEFNHSAAAISGFMLILQQVFGGMLAAFALVLLFVTFVVLAHSISGVIEDDYVNLGILQTVGVSAGQLARIQQAQYVIVILAGMAIGVIASMPLNQLIAGMTVTTTGVLIPTGLPVGLSLLLFTGMLVLLVGFIHTKLNKIRRVTPMKVIRGEAHKLRWKPRRPCSLKADGLSGMLAVRQLITGLHHYIGVCIVAALLVFITSLVGRIDVWLGPDGSGMMAAFNPADLDIGIQALGEQSIEDMTAVVRSYTGITDEYRLAMPNVTVNDIDYGANVITEPQRFHILQGQTSLNENEIVVTETVAANFGVKPGDTLMVGSDLGTEEFVISGIYQCANDMGDNIGMSREGYLRIGKDNRQMWCYHYFLADPGQRGPITEALNTIYAGDVHVHENSWPGLLGIISAMQALTVLMYAMVTVFILIVTMMTGNKLMSYEQKDMAIYQSLGFSSGQLRTAFSIRFGMAAAVGAVIGCLMAALMTDPLVSAIMRLAGISDFTSHPSFSRLIFPAVLVSLLFGGFAFLAGRKIKKCDLSLLISD